MMDRLEHVAAWVCVLALAACGQKPQGAPETPPPAASAQAEAPPNFAPLAYIVSQHSPLLDDAARTAISQDFHGAPLSGARTQHQVNAESVRCRAFNAPSSVPECFVAYVVDQEVAITGEDAPALSAALAAAGVLEEGGMSHLSRELTALRCLVDDAAAQDIPANGDRIAGFSCQFNVN